MNLCKAIEDYLKKDKINYAILVNGEWGTGKTTFIKNNFVKKYDNILYISINGVSSIDKLSEKIYLEIIKSRTNSCKLIKFLKKTYKIKLFKILFYLPVLLLKFIKFIVVNCFKIIWSIVCWFINYKYDYIVPNFTKKDFYGLLKLVKNFDNYTLVIDDLERCLIPIEEVFGLLNDFVEHKNVKCIIIANEKEIYNTIYNNYEMKLLTALNNHVIYENDDLVSENKISVNNLKRRVIELYKDSNSYKVIKEKLIGKQFIFVPKLDEIYDSLSEKYKNNYSFYIILKNTKNNVLDIMKRTEFNNIRTLDFYFDNFYHIFLNVNKFVEASRIDNNYIYSSIASCIMYGCIRLKQGKSLPLISNENGFDYIDYDDDKKMFVFFSLNFDFVNEYLLYNCISMSNIEKTILNFADSNCDKLSSNDPFYRLDTFWFYTSEQLVDILNEIHNNILNDMYRPSLYILILKKLSYIEAYGFKDSIINTIVINIKGKIEMLEQIEIDDLSFMDNNDAKNIFHNYINIIRNNKKENFIFNKELDLNNIFSTNNWGEKLYDFVNKNKDKFLLTKGFFSQINIENIISLLKNATIKDIFNFKYSLDFMYDSSNDYELLSADLKKLKKFKNKLIKSISISNIKDPMIRHPFELLLERVNNIIYKFELNS